MIVSLVCKCKSRWHLPLKTALLCMFNEVHFIYLNELIKSKSIFPSGNSLVSSISEIITSHNTTHIIFDLEFSLLLSPWEVKSIVEKTDLPSFGIAIDDDRFHDINKFTYAGLHSILTFPLSVERYRLIRREAYPFFPFFELAQDNKRDINVEKDIDVLFYGLRKGDRDKKLSVLESNGVEVYCVDFSTKYEDLVKLISRSKIVINFSMGSPIVTTPLRFVPFIEYKEKPIQVKQLKSRIFEVANRGTLCVSEDFASDSLIFSHGSLPIAHSNEELVDIVKTLISDKEKYAKQYGKFMDEFNQRYNFEKRCKEFKEHILNITATPPSNELVSYTSVLHNACCLATKTIYGKNLRVLNPFIINAPISIFHKIKISMVASIILIVALTRYIWRKDGLN